MLDLDDISLLSCPMCQEGALVVSTDSGGDRTLREGELICESCETTYPVRDGVPDLIPHERLNTSEWRLWEDHLEGLKARREQRHVAKDSHLVNRASTASRLGDKEAFCRFTEIDSGRVLDVGCGSGNIRHRLDPYGGGRVQYFGVDPIPLPEMSDFRCVRGIAEYVPFRDDTFEHVIVTSSMDHFSDPDRFFEEVIRVLVPDGRFHLLQTIHDLSGPIKTAKTLAHVLKDLVDLRQTTVKNPNAPKHLAEYNRTTILRTLEKRFEVTAESKRAARWYGPTKLFVSMRPLAGQPA